MKTVAIFCGANQPKNPIFTTEAVALAQRLVAAGCDIVTGGGDLGLMKTFNEAAIEAGGRAIGVIPQFMVDRGWHHKSLSAMHVVDTMQDRKLRMAQLAADAVIAYPGGVGTYDELFEFIALRKLGVWGGKIYVYNLNGYFDPFKAMVQKAIEEGFMAQTALDVYRIVDNADQIIADLNQ